MDPAAKVGRLEADGLPLSGAVLLPGDPGPGLALACTSAAAELVGLAAELVARSVAHAGERVQFGRPIGAFQAVKHQIVDAHVAVERARSLVRHAAVLAAAGDPEAPTAARLAKAAAGEAASGAARTGVQVHGGIGITEEHDVSRLYLRARQLSALLGGADGHYVAVARARLES
jgi:alkylation response protein AidB-like acyl-CoA dehydrogenase